MITLSGYIQYLFFLIPVFSASTCGSMTILSIRDSQSKTEKRLKKIVSCYLFAAAVSWFCIFAFQHIPATFVITNALCYLSFLLVQVLFYHFFYVLTRTNKKEYFSKKHYMLPFVISALLFIWSFFVPFEVQLSIVEERGQYIPEGYEAYSYFFLSKPLMRLLFGIVYVILTFIRLQKYGKAISHPSGMRGKLQSWVLFLMVLALSSILCSLAGTLTPRAAVFNSPVMFLTAGLIICQHIVITYYIVRRQFMPYVLVNVHDINEESGQADTESEKKTKQVPFPLTPKNFEAYIHKNKLYLRQDLKITDLVNELGINRTYISRFINHTYGVNFNRYINRCRLKELDRLIKRPSNASKNPAQLAEKAGFRDGQHYRRALETEIEQKNNG